MDSRLRDYYRNLLILQYRSQPTALDTVEAFVDPFIVAELIDDVKNGYDIDTAVGAQLDAIGKYVGVRRGGIDDEDYRFFLRLKIIQNTGNHSGDSVNSLLFNIFGGDVYVDDNANMTITYYVAEAEIDLFLFAVDRGFLPRPMAVGVDFIGFVPDFFGFDEDPDALGYGALLVGDLEGPEGEVIETPEETTIEALFNTSDPDLEGAGRYSFLLS